MKSQSRQVYRRSQRILCIDGSLIAVKFSTLKIARPSNNFQCRQFIFRKKNRKIHFVLEFCQYRLFSTEKQMSSVVRTRLRYALILCYQQETSASAQCMSDTNPVFAPASTRISLTRDSWQYILSRKYATCIYIDSRIAICMHNTTEQSTNRRDDK